MCYLKPFKSLGNNVLSFLSNFPTEPPGALGHLAAPLGPPAPSAERGSHFQRVPRPQGRPRGDE